MPDTAIQPYHGSYLMPSLEHATVADAMHPGILSCEADATVTDVARMMATHHVHCVAVMHPAHDDPSDSYVWGITSDLDLVGAGVSPSGEESAGALA
jgi:CBS domain-containing protein